MPFYSGLHQNKPFSCTEEDKIRTKKMYGDYVDFVWRQLYRFGVHKPDLEDAVHDVFLIVLKKVAEYTDDRPAEPWLSTIAYHVACNRNKKHHLKQEVLFETLPEEVVSSELTPEEHALFSDEELYLNQILSKLEPEKRAAFIMVVLEEIPGKEVSRLLGVPLGTVHSRVHHARSEILSRIEEDRKASLKNIRKEGTHVR